MIFKKKYKDSEKLKVALLSVFKTEPPEKDKEALWIQKEVRREGHELLFYKQIKSDFLGIGGAVIDAIKKEGADVLILKGGTGIERENISIEACKPLLHRELKSFEFIFSNLSFELSGAKALAYRAMAGTIGKSLVFCIPHDKKACRLACRELIFMELDFLLKKIKKE